jgi:hypothetical protein
VSAHGGSAGPALLVPEGLHRQRKGQKSSPACSGCSSHIAPKKRHFCSGGLHAADVSHVAKELVEEQPEEYTGEEDAEPYFYPSWEHDGFKLWPVLVRPALLLLRCMNTEALPK